MLTKEKNSGGEVSVGTVTSQIVYEIQGPFYYNSDVTADIEYTKVEQVGEDRVKVWNIKGLPPPPTTKVGCVQLLIVLARFGTNSSINTELLLRQAGRQNITFI